MRRKQEIKAVLHASAEAVRQVQEELSALYAEGVEQRFAVSMLSHEQKKQLVKDTLQSFQVDTENRS